MADLYEFTLRYAYDKPLDGLFIGDGVPSKDGASLYLPLANVGNPSLSLVSKIRVSDLVGEGSVGFNGGGVFSPPNSVALLSDMVLAGCKNNIVNKLGHDLKFDKGVPLFWYDVITNLKGSPNESKFVMLGMEQESSNRPRYSYAISVRSFS